MGAFTLEQMPRGQINTSQQLGIHWNSTVGPLVLDAMRRWMTIGQNYLKELINFIFRLGTTTMNRWLNPVVSVV